MREIKFRFWDDVINHMYYGEEVEDSNNELRSNWYCITKGHGLMVGNAGPGGDSYDLTTMQYTGLKDKNGKEIYEGDIYRSCEGTVCEVVWHDNGFKGLYISHRSYQGEKYTEKVYMELRETVDRRWGIEVIGNIYKNKELLEVE